MTLSKATANRLINEISTVIDYDINIMDNHGAIIASTNPSRVGQFHEAAWLIIDNNLNELLVHYDNEYKGCKKGTNLPLLTDEDIIGVIGITGDVEKTVKYGNLIKKITEILMKDIISLQRQTRKEQSRLFFVRELLSGEIDQISEVERRIRKYEFKNTGVYQVALLHHLNSHQTTRNFFSTCIDSTKCLTSWNNDYGVIVGNFSSSEKCLEYIKASFNSKFPASDFQCAVGDTFDSIMSVQISYEQALSTLKIFDSNTATISLYNEKMLNVLIDTIPSKKREKFSKLIFSNFKEKELPDIIQFINLYEQCNGSINTMAKEIFVHKNTIQYKINKILSVTGLDLRVIKDMMKLILAAKWYK